MLYAPVSNTCDDLTLVILAWMIGLPGWLLAAENLTVTGDIAPLEGTAAVIELKADRLIVEWAYNRLEGDDPQASPKIVRYEAGEYRRENEKTPNREVSTRFGKITLWRFPYRYRHRDRNFLEVALFTRNPIPIPIPIPSPIQTISFPLLSQVNSNSGSFG